MLSYQVCYVKIPGVFGRSNCFGGVLVLISFVPNAIMKLALGIFIHIYH